MKIIGSPSPRLHRALDIIDQHLHQTFAKNVWIAHPDKSKESCIMSSLAVRDFLQEIGMTDARQKVCMLMIEAREKGEQLHSLACGHPEADGTGWPGHMVVLCENFLIDTTMYQAIRKQWADLPGMMALPLHRSGKLLTACSMTEGDYRCDVAWVKQPKAEHSWLTAPDVEASRRKLAVDMMVKAYRTPGDLTPDERRPYVLDQC